jgi:hypothetical protein
MCVFARFLSKNITHANGVNFRALYTHPQTKPRALNTAPTPPNLLLKVPQNTVMWNEPCASNVMSNVHLGMSASAMPKRGAQNDVCSSNNFMGIYGLNSTNSTDNTRFKLRSTHPGWPDGGLMLASRLSYKWMVLGHRCAWRGEKGACSYIAYV